MNTTPTDTPETDALRESYAHLGPNWLAFEVFAKASERFERRARAAEARVKELEAEVSRINGFRERKALQHRAKTGELENKCALLSLALNEARAALRLRPIAEAGPVPEGMIRLYARFYGGLAEWFFYSNPNKANLFIDIYPPAQAQEGGRA